VNGAGERRRGGDPKAIGELLAGTAAIRPPASAKKVWVGNVRRTFQPVRRQSYAVGEREHKLWNRIGNGSRQDGKRFAGAYLAGARRYELDNKPAGKVNGPLGHVGLEVLRILLELVDFASGRLEPSIDTLMQRTRRSRAAVCGALERLKSHGFVTWIRRTEPVENPEPFGQQVRQATNAYGFSIAALPKAVSGLIRRIFTGSPPPDDAAWAQEQDARDQEAMYRSVPLAEAGSARFPGDPAMAAAFNKLGAALSNASSPDGQNPGEVEPP